LETEAMETSFFLSREKIVPFAGWRNGLFAAMARNAGNISDYFNIPGQPRHRGGDPRRDLTPFSEKGPDPFLGVRGKGC